MSKISVYGGNENLDLWSRKPYPSLVAEKSGILYPQGFYSVDSHRAIAEIVCVYVHTHVRAHKLYTG